MPPALPGSDFFDYNEMSYRYNKMIEIAFLIYTIIYSNGCRMRDSYPYIIIILLTSIFFSDLSYFFSYLSLEASLN